MTENRKNYRLDVDKIKTLKDVKNVLDSIRFVAYYDPEDPNDENYYLSEYFTILEEPQELKFSTPRKNIEEICQEFDEKFDKLIETTKEKFEYSKISSEKRYKYEFDKIFKKFEYAKKNGKFAETLTIGGAGSFLISNGSCFNWVTSNYIIKPDANCVGYYEISPNVQFWMKKKPNFIVRNCAKILLDLTWKDD